MGRVGQADVGGAQEFDLDGFLGHSTRSGGGQFLGNWKEDGAIDVWLHPKANPIAIWCNRWFRVVEDREKRGVKRLIGWRWISYEPELVLKNRFKTNDDGRRKYPPSLDPFAMFLQWVEDAIGAGELNWTDKVFEFEAGSDVVEVLAGGITGLFQSRDLDDDQKRELKKAHVRIREAYKQNAHAKCSYIFRVVKVAAPEEGAHIAVERSMVGECMQRAIGKEIKRHGAKGKELGNPMVHPYPFRWEYDDREEVPIYQRYDVTALAEEPSEVVLAAFAQDPPGVEELTKAGNLVELRRSFEAHWCGPIVPPWDDFFAPAMKRFAGTPQAQAPEEFAYGANAEESEQEEAAAEGGGAPAEEVACLACGAAMGADEEACPSCGALHNLCAKCDARMLATATRCEACGAEYDPKTGDLLPDKPKPAPKPPARPMARRGGTAGKAKGRS
jgi:predicted RNA-binding Zn-ribbon protein involved in translation (DUF1610 family)